MCYHNKTYITSTDVVTNNVLSEVVTLGNKVVKQKSESVCGIAIFDREGGEEKEEIEIR